MANEDRPRLVVIGSGWMGLYMVQYINTTLYAVTIVSPRRTSSYTLLLASAACGPYPFSCAEESLRAKGRDCDYVKANVLSMDFAGKKVHCEPAFDDDDDLREKTFDLEHDKLIICPGCEWVTHPLLPVYK
jgi:NADH:ubiquinone reductase (non-electrogenic)